MSPPSKIQGRPSQPKPDFTAFPLLRGYPLLASFRRAALSMGGGPTLATGVRVPNRYSSQSFGGEVTERCWCRVSGSQSTGYPNTSPTVGFGTAMGMLASPHALEIFEVRSPSCCPARRCSGLGLMYWGHGATVGARRLAWMSHTPGQDWRQWQGDYACVVRRSSPRFPSEHPAFLPLPTGAGWGCASARTRLDTYLCEQLTLDSARPPGLHASRIRYPPKTLVKLPFSSLLRHLEIRRDGMKGSAS